jgi:hypothetical protein
MGIEIVDIIQEKVEMIIELHEKYRASSCKLEDELRAMEKSQLDMVIPNRYNPDRDNVFDYIKNLSRIEQDTVKALSRFGRNFDMISKEDFENCIKTTRCTGEHEIEDMISHTLSKYLRHGLMKLDLIEPIKRTPL